MTVVALTCAQCLYAVTTYISCKKVSVRAGRGSLTALAMSSCVPHAKTLRLPWCKAPPRSPTRRHASLSIYSQKKVLDQDPICTFFAFLHRFVLGGVVIMVAPEGVLESLARFVGVPARRSVPATGASGHAHPDLACSINTCAGLFACRASEALLTPTLDEATTPPVVVDPSAAETLAKSLDLEAVARACSPVALPLRFDNRTQEVGSGQRMGPRLLGKGREKQIQPQPNALL